MEYTAAPWTIRYRAAGAAIAGTDGHGTLAKVQVRRSKMNYLTEMVANARLIAAAPTLADLLSSCCEYVEKYGELSEAPSDSDCWKVLEASRNLLAEIAGQPLPYPKRAA